MSGISSVSNDDKHPSNFYVWSPFGFLWFQWCMILFLSCGSMCYLTSSSRSWSSWWSKTWSAATVTALLVLQLALLLLDLARLPLAHYVTMILGLASAWFAGFLASENLWSVSTLPSTMSLLLWLVLAIPLVGWMRMRCGWLLSAVQRGKYSPWDKGCYCSFVPLDLIQFTMEMTWWKYLASLLFQLTATAITSLLSLWLFCR